MNKNNKEELVLSETEYRLYGELSHRYPKRVSTVRLGRVSGSYATSSMISKLRKKLNKFGWTILSEDARDSNKKFYYRLVYAKR